jgi:hypothetical protein
MAYPTKVKERALQLRSSDKNLSAEKITAILCKEFHNDLDPTRFSPRTVRLWLAKGRDVQEHALTKDVKEYDKKVFKRLDRMMNDKDFYEYFYLLKAGHSSYHDKIHKLSKYCYYTEFESYKHAYAPLKRLFSDFLKKLDDLAQYILPHSFTVDGNPNIIRVMPYEHRKYMSEDEFQEYIDRFMELIDIAEKAYIKYRAAIRDTLLI